MTISSKISEKTLNKIINNYKSYQLDNPTQYVIFFAKMNDMTITVFKSPKKILYSLTVSCKNQKLLNQLLKSVGIDKDTLIQKSKDINVSEASAEFLFLDDQIGSDEVGTGDFFGPITVVAALVKHSQIQRIKQLGIMDSKKISDDKIRQLGKIVIKEFKYSSLTLDNKTYNDLVINRKFNMNKIKCYLHNRAQYNLHVKFPKITNHYIDQFENEKSYYKHLEGEKNVLKGIYFHTKGESYFPSVALASVIARYSFLIHMDELNKKYKCVIPFGAGKQVNEFAIKFKNKYGINELKKITKNNFVNLKKIEEN